MASAVQGRVGARLRWCGFVAAALAVVALVGPGVTGASAATPTSVALPITSFAGMAVDGTNSHVLISSPLENDVVVRNLDGSADTTITGITYAGQIAIDPTGTYAYVLEGFSGANSAIVQIDLSTLTVVQTFPVGAAAACPDDLTFAGGLIWFTYDHSNCQGLSDAHSGLASLDPADGTVSAHNETTGQYDLVAASPDGHTLYTGQQESSPASFARYDITDPTNPQPLVSSGGWFSCSTLGQITLSPDGTTLYYACGSATAFDALASADLSPQTTYPATSYPSAVTTTADGDYVAGASAEGDPGVWVYKVGQAASPRATFALSQAFVREGAIAFTPDASRLYVVSGEASTYDLTTITDPTLAQPDLTLSPAASQVAPGAAVDLTGTLGFTDGSSASGIALHVTRTNPDQRQTVLPDATTGSGGSIAVTDQPPLVAGTYTYTVSYDGDSTRAAGDVRTTVSVVFPTPTLTLLASAAAIGPGKDVMLHAHLGPHGSVNTITLVTKLWNGTTSSRQITVDGSGNATITVAPKSDTSYEVTFPGDTVDLPATSPIRTVDVRAKEAGAMAGFYKTTAGYHLYHYRPSCVSRAHSHCPAFGTAVSPDNAGGRLRFRVETHTGGAWRTALLGTVRLSARSTSALIVFYGSKRIEGIRFRVRGEFLRSSRNLGTTSAWQYFCVTS